MVGKILSHYHITEKLGQGGMGEVYRAEDTNLSRQVAIKVLPDEFAHDAERLARFEREAKLLASLNHPNIAAIHGLEEHEGKRFLVLELVEGQTLAERLKKGRIPLDETLDICSQIAEGLEAAHEKGIIHRDLKPANVKVTPEGKVKILDFGLAKAFYEKAAPVDPSRSPTITEQMTAPGVILGTAAYMSPEQARGKTVDKRADIWAFGCVLYECLTAKRAFQGDTITEVVASILKSEPDWTLFPVETPGFVLSLLRRCLQKDLNLRLRDIGDARIEMNQPAFPPVQAKPVSRKYSALPLAVGASMMLVAGILIGFSLMSRLRPVASIPVVRAAIRVESGRVLAGWRLSMDFMHPSRTALAISSDGRFIVYSAVAEPAEPGSREQLYLRKIDQIAAQPIAGTEGGICPFLSPDARWAGFWADGKLMKVAVDGGVPTALCDATMPFGASWGADGSIIFSPERETGLFRVSAAGGKPEGLSTPDNSKGEYSHRLPHCLPNGKGVLFTVMRDLWDIGPRIAALDLATRKWHVLIEDGADARYVPPGYISFLRRGILMVAPFNINSLKTAGTPVPAIPDVMQALNSAHIAFNTTAGQFSISQSGTLVYAPGGILTDPENSLVWVDLKGNVEPAAPFKAAFSVPRLAPDGRRIVYTTSGRERRVWVYDPGRGTRTPLTDEGISSSVIWTPDGKRVLFHLSRTGGDGFLCWRPADGSSPMEELVATGPYGFVGSGTPDGDTLAYVEFHETTEHDILMFQMKDRQRVPFQASKACDFQPTFSPDARWLAYSSSESGSYQVYVQPSVGHGGKWQISSDGGRDPLWARSGRQLFYRAHGQVSAVDVVADKGFSASKPHVLFSQPFFGTGEVPSWDISPDGKRFLMVKLDERKPQPVTEMILVQNWLEELKRLCPTGK